MHATDDDPSLRPDGTRGGGEKAVEVGEPG